MSQIPYPQWPQEIPPERLLVLASELDGSVEATRLRLEEKRKRLLEAGVLLPGLEPPEQVFPMRLQQDGPCAGGGDGDGDGGGGGGGGGDDDWDPYRDGVSSGGDFRMLS